MRNPIRYPFLLAFLLSSSAIAHNTIPDGWCPAGSTVKVVGSFSFTPEQLQAYRDSMTPIFDEAQCSAKGSEKTCGIIDDWYWAHQLSGAGCGGMGRMMGSSVQAVPFVESPAEFNATNHHDVYEFTDGMLQGPCAICVSTTAPPTSDDSVVK